MKYQSFKKQNGSERKCGWLQKGLCSYILVDPYQLMVKRQHEMKTWGFFWMPRVLQLGEKLVRLAKQLILDLLRQDRSGLSKINGYMAAIQRLQTSVCL